MRGAAESAELQAAIEDAIRAAFPTRWWRILVDVDAWMADEPPSFESDYPLSCLMCGRRQSAVGVASGENPFFGRVGGWDEAGGVRWLCAICVNRANARACDPSPLDVDAILADAVRATSGAFGADSEASARLRAGHAADRPFWSRIGECTCCLRTIRVHGTSEDAMCGPCATGAQAAITKGYGKRQASPGDE